MDDDTRTVVLTRKSKSDTDYLLAVVHPTKESAEAGVAEAQATAPWYHHNAVSLSDFTANTGEES